MKKGLLPLLFVLLSMVSVRCLDLGFYSASTEEGKSGSSEVFAIKKSADRVIWHNKEKSFDLGLGELKDGVRFPIRFKFSEMRAFLEHEKHKGMVVVWFDKTLMWNERDFIQNRAKEVTEQMRDVGYQRVVVLGAHSVGVHYLADTAIEKSE